MSINANWARWIFASVSDHFNTRFPTVELYIEGQHRDTSKLKEYLELRMDGPTWNEASKGYFIGSIDINILVTVTVNEEEYHRPHQLAGEVQATFDKSIDVFKYGCNPQDDQSHLGCLSLKQNRSNRDFVELNQFGIIGTDVPLMQSTVEGHYEITFCVEE
jgi:hypothetical protein